MSSNVQRDASILEQIRWDLIRLEMQANAIGQPLLAFMLDQAAFLAADELARHRQSGCSAPQDKASQAAS